MAKVSPGDRAKHGMKGTGKGDSKKYPVETHAQCMSAIKLRHNGKGVSASAVLAHVAARARSQGWKDVLAAVARAREEDAKRK